MDCEIVHRVLHGSNACKQGTLIGLPDGKLSGLTICCIYTNHLKLISQ